MMKLAKELTAGDFVTYAGVEGVVVDKFTTMNVARDVLVALTLDLRGEMHNVELPVTKLITVKV